MSGIRKKQNHPIADRCLRKSAGEYTSLTEVAQRNKVTVSNMHKLVDGVPLDIYADKAEEWSRAFGVSPDDFLEEVKRYISERKQISTQQSKTAS